MPDGQGKLVAKGLGALVAGLDAKALGLVFVARAVLKHVDQPEDGLEVLFLDFLVDCTPQGLPLGGAVGDGFCSIRKAGVALKGA